MSKNFLAKQKTGAPRRFLGDAPAVPAAAARNDGIKDMERNFCVYILTNQKGNVMYIGVTNDLVRRVYEHNNGMTEGFTKKYRIGKLVYYECYSRALDAIAREKQLKGWNRKKKEDLVRTMNPEKKDLAFMIEP